MGESSPPTAADWNRHIAAGAQRSVEEVERQLNAVHRELNWLQENLLRSGLLTTDEIYPPPPEPPQVLTYFSPGIPVREDRVQPEDVPPETGFSSLKNKAIRQIAALLRLADPSSRSGTTSIRQRIEVAKIIYAHGGRVIHDAVAADMQESNPTHQGEPSP